MAAHFLTPVLLQNILYRNIQSIHISGTTEINDRLDRTSFYNPKSSSWTGWSARFLGCRARRNDAEWLFHSKELQRSHVPQKTCNSPCSELTKKVKVKYRKKIFVDHNSILKSERSTAGFRIIAHT
jgi:hypothetical protein